MERVIALGRRVLPRGWRDFGIQLVIWFGFYFSYLAVRSLTDRQPGDAKLAVANGLRVISLERRLTHHLLELTAQRVVDSSHVLLTAAAWTYWNSEFTVMGLTMLWVYLRRNERFTRFRNTILLANLIGLVGFAVMPTAPPWMLQSYGFVGGVNHSSALLKTFGNQYAAMPSLHAADALIVGWFLVATSRRIWSKALWALWPAWVWFCVVATANHYLLDVLAGIGVAVASILTTTWVAPRLAGRLRTLGPAIANLL
ncbi:MAG: phosphatase PAP2 family protein [Gaiellaceae bacterium]